jgi:hypothetical protein
MSANFHVEQRDDRIARRRAASVRAAQSRRQIADARKIERAGLAIAAPPAPKAAPQGYSVRDILDRIRAAGKAAE